MSAIGFITTLRKLRYFLSTMFPALERLFSPSEAFLSQVRQHPALLRAAEYVRESRLGRTGHRIVRSFWWVNYASNAVDLKLLPRETVAILRPVFAAAALLCLLIPVAMHYPHPGLPAEAINEAKGPVAVWSVVLWLVCYAAVWGCLLSGAVAANRLVTLAAIVLYFYYMGAAAPALAEAGGSAARSFFNLLPAPAAVAAAFAAEYARGRPGLRNRLAGFILNTTAWTGAGMLLLAFTPASALVRGGSIRWISALALGGAAGLAAIALAARLQTRLGEARPRLWKVHQFAAGASVCCLAYLLSLWARGGLAVPANAISSFVTTWSGYLWPLYYLIGVGVIFKVMTQSRVLTLTIQELVPARFYVGLTVIAIVAGLLVGWAPLILDTVGLPWPETVINAAGVVYHYSAPFSWADPFLAITWEWIRWILILDFGAILWLGARRKLNGEIASSLVFITLLVGLFVYEYLFQMRGFTRTPGHSALLLFSFSIMVLWLVHKTGLQFTFQSSPRWPSVGRFGLYGAILLSVLLTLHVRAATHNPRIVTEIFFYLFNGIMAVGLPYYLYVYAVRTLPRLPVSLHHLFLSFSFGAALTVPLAILDKFVAAGGSISAASLTLDTQARRALEAGIYSIEGPSLPFAWAAVRGALVVLSWAFLWRCARRRLGSNENPNGAVIFMTVSAAMGFASFSHMRLELPLLPIKLQMLITPFNQSVHLDVQLVVLHLMYGIPALIFGLVITREASVKTRDWIAGPVSAYVLHLGFAALWPARESWLRSTGLLITSGLAAVLVFCVLVLAARTRVENMLGEANSRGAGLRILTFSVAQRAGIAVLAAVLAVLAAIGVYQGYSGRDVHRPVAGLDRPLALHAAWSPEPKPGPGAGALFRRTTLRAKAPTLIVDVEDAPPGGTLQHLKDFAAGAKANLPEFWAGSLEQWNSRYDGALALDFVFLQKLQNGNEVYVYATKALLPLRDGRLLVMTLLASLADWEQQRWDLIRVAEALNRAPAPGMPSYPAAATH